MNIGSIWTHTKTGNKYRVSHTDAQLRKGKVWVRAVVYYRDEYPESQQIYVRSHKSFLKKFVEDRS